MRTARSWGVPLSVLRGGEVGSWSESDGLLAAALTVYEDGLCSGCRQPVDESMDPESDGDDPRAVHRYEVPPPSRCHACTALSRMQEKYDEAKHPAALRFRVVRALRRKRSVS